MRKNLKKAFTLVEMLIVVIIIGILMAALLPRLKGAQERTRDTARKANLSQISTALEMYFNDYGTYPAGQCANELKDTLVPQYLSDIPSDPQKSRIAYGTKDGGCTNGSYAYTPLYRNGAASGGSVLVANIEAEGRVGNFILLPDTTKKTFDPTSTTQDTRGGKQVSSNTTDGGGDLDETQDHFKAADVAENAICQTTKVNTTVTKETGCWGPKPVTEGVAKANQYMVYVRFN